MCMCGTFLKNHSCSCITKCIRCEYIYIYPYIYIHIFVHSYSIQHYTFFLDFLGDLSFPISPQHPKPLPRCIPKCKNVMMSTWRKDSCCFKGHIDWDVPFTTRNIYIYTVYIYIYDICTYISSFLSGGSYWPSLLQNPKSVLGVVTRATQATPHNVLAQKGRSISLKNNRE